MSPPRLHPDDLAAIVEGTARRVVELMGEARPDPPGRLLTAAEVAAMLGVRREVVYARQRELGAVRIGDGPKARLRFDPAKVTAALAPRQETAGPPPPRPRGRRASGPARPALSPAGRPLLPVAIDEEAS